MSNSISLSREKARERVSSGKFLFSRFSFLSPDPPIHRPGTHSYLSRVVASHFGSLGPWKWNWNNGEMWLCSIVAPFPVLLFLRVFSPSYFLSFPGFYSDISLSLPGRNDGACYFSFLKMNINLPFHIFLSVCSGGIRAKHREVFSYFLSQNFWSDFR